jgi:hypothetical protein
MESWLLRLPAVVQTLHCFHFVLTCRCLVSYRCLQLDWLRTSKDAELQGLDLSQGIGSGMRGNCFPCLPCCQD